VRRAEDIRNAAASVSFYRAALEPFEQARALAPNDETFLVALGRVYDALGRFQEAEWMYGKARDWDPKSLAVQKSYAAHLARWSGTKPVEAPPRWNLPDKNAPLLSPGLIVFALALASVPPSLRSQDEESGKTAVNASSSAVGGEKETAGSDLGTGNFARSPFRISVSVREGHDDNAYTTNQNPVGSFFTNGTVVFDYKFGNARTQFDLHAFGGATYPYYRPFGQDYDINSGLTLSVSHQVTPRLGFAGSAYLAYQSEPDFNTGIGINRRNGNYFYTTDKFSTSYRWASRFSTVTSYTLGVVNYEDSAIGAYEDRFEHTFGNEFRFLVLPTTALVGEYRYQITNFDTAPRDSMTHFALSGVDHSFNPRFNVSLRSGVEFREFDNFDERTSPYGEATLKYSLGPRTSVSWTNRYGLDEPDVPVTPSRTTFRTGLNVAYAITARLTSSLALFYQAMRTMALPRRPLSSQPSTRIPSISAWDFATKSIAPLPCSPATATPKSFRISFSVSTLGTDIIWV
jgi:hypothetical protein